MDEHVVPCGADWELIRGRRVKVMSAELPHSRMNKAICLFPLGQDPERGGRRLDELVFEISTTRSNQRRDTTKARILSARGVRRIFPVLLKGGPVAYEWDTARDGWVQLAEDGEIVDRALAAPIPVRLLLHPELVPDAVGAWRGSPRASCGASARCCSTRSASASTP